MKAAMKWVDITPSGVFYLDGYLNQVRREPALGVHDHPYGILLLLEFETARVMFVSIDVCTLSRAATLDLRRQLAQSVGVPEEHIVISAVHSHSCPTGFGDGLIDKASHGFESKATGAIVEASTRLVQDLVEVDAEFASAKVAGWYSNRNDPDRPFDDSAAVIRFVDREGDVIGAMLNFNCHATVVGPHNRYLTVDVIGAVRDELSDWIGAMPLTFTGASADLGNRQFRRGNDFAELKRVSNGIAGEIMKSRFEALPIGDPTHRRFSYSVRYDNEKYHDKYRDMLKNVHRRLESSPSADEMKLLGTAESMLEEKLAVSAVSFPIEMDVFDFGALVLVTFPGELASDLGMRIKGMFGERMALIMGYANDYQGYFIPSYDFGYNYEALVSNMPQGGIEKVLDAFEEWL